MVVREPQAAGDYDDRTTTAVKSVLIEIGQIPGSFEGKFAIIGGAVPWLLLGDADMSHIGTGDVDLALDPAALGDGEYVQLVEDLQEHDYHQRDNLRCLQLVRTVPARDDGPDIDVVVDFLMPRDAKITRNATPLISQFAVQRADGADLALRFNQMVTVDGLLHDATRPPGRAPVAEDRVKALIALAMSPPPPHASHWTLRALAERMGMVFSTVHNILRKHGLELHRVKTFKVPRDPAFEANDP